MKYITLVLLLIPQIVLADATYLIQCVFTTHLNDEQFESYNIQDTLILTQSESGDVSKTKSTRYKRFLVRKSHNIVTIDVNGTIVRITDSGSARKLISGHVWMGLCKVNVYDHHTFDT